MTVRRDVSVHLLIALGASALFASDAGALVVDSGPVTIAVPASASGAYVNLVTGGSTSADWDFHPAADVGGALVFVAAGTSTFLVGSGTPRTLSAGMSIGPASVFASSGTFAAPAFRAGGTHYAGIRLVDESSGLVIYGYVEISTTAPSGFPATIVRYAFESSGAAITVPGDARIFADNFQPIVVAASCSSGHVLAALTAAPDGATVTIPPGDCDWGAVEVTRAAGVTVRGAGRRSTTIRRTAPMLDYSNATLEFDCANGKTVELSDLRFVGNDDLQTEEQRLVDYDVGVALENGCVDFSIHDMEFSKFSHAGLIIRGHGERGVVYRSDFLSNFKCQPDPVSCLGYGVAILGDSSQPQPPLALGTRDAVYVEDSYFRDNRHGVASNYGSRYVVRHDTLVTTQRARDFAMVDAHGRQAPSSIGSRSWEIHDNALKTDPPTMVADGIGLRGGDGVVFGNVLFRIPYVVKFSNETCTGTYPLADQTRDAHVWNNTWQPVPGYNPDSIWIGTGCESFLVENRDFFRTARPGYAPYAYPHPLR